MTGIDSSSWGWRSLLVLGFCAGMAWLAAPALGAKGQFYMGGGGQWVKFHELALEDVCIAEAANGFCLPDMPATLPTLDEDTWFFVNLGYQFTDNFRMEINVFDIDPKVSYPRAMNGMAEMPARDDRLDIDHLKLDAHINLGFDLGPGKPFFAVGYGRTRFDNQQSETLDRDLSDGVWSFGLGVEFPVTERLGFRTTLRSLHPQNRKTRDRDYGADLAMVFYLGSKEPPRPPRDSDGDGVIDPNDDCPDTPLEYAVDGRGCPIAEREVARFDLRVEFDFDRALVKPQYMAAVQGLADFMRQNPDLVVEIEGHTDSVGTDAYNYGLSARRITAVRQLLIERYGVSPGRLTTSAYGEERPIVSNATREGRARNRRVVAVATRIQQRYQQRQ